MLRLSVKTILQLPGTARHTFSHSQNLPQPLKVLEINHLLRNEGDADAPSSPSFSHFTRFSGGLQSTDDER